MVVNYSIQIREMYISKGHDFKKRFGMERLHHETLRVDSVECVAGKGIVGDRYFGYKDDFKGQISFISEEVIESVAASIGLQDVDGMAFRRNAVTRGIDLNELVGKSFRIGEVVLYGSEECRPCFWMDEAVGPNACQLLEGRGGLRCRIQESGWLRVGQADVEILG